MNNLRPELCYDNIVVPTGNKNVLTTTANGAFSKKHTIPKFMANKGLNNVISIETELYHMQAFVLSICIHRRLDLPLDVFFFQGCWTQSQLYKLK